MGLITLTAQAIDFMSPQMGWGAWSFTVIIAFACLVCSAFVSGSEIAYFGLTASDIDDLREHGDNARCRKAFGMISDSERLLATILISNNLVNVTMVILLTFAISQTVIFNNAVIAFLLQTVVLTMLLLLFGEIFPKLAAKSFRLKWVKAAAPVL